MKITRRSFLLAVIVCALALPGAWARADDPLPSWNDGPAKKSITDFVAKVTDEGSADFVKPEDRIATFDNDGTLWCEKPLPVQLQFALDRVKAMAPDHPEWKDQEPFKFVLSDDMKGLMGAGTKGLVEIMMTTHSGMTTDEYNQIVKDWLKTARDARFNKPYTSLAYQPMLELLAYLRANGFKTYIVSGGGIEFMRCFAEDVYGVPPEQVIGSSGVTKFEIRDGTPVLIKEPEIHFVDDGPGKPVGINEFIGRRPIMAFGNSDGDLQMLEYTGAGSGARYCLYVHHDDADREYAYDRDDALARLDKGLDEAAVKGWTVVSMKNDWKTIFPPDLPPVSAVDIALEPDDTMIQHATAVNARLLSVFPKGFALDATHHPHISMLQRYVRTADLDKVYAAAQKVLASEQVTGLKLKAFKYYYIKDKTLGLAGIVVQPTPELLKIQQDLIDAVAPYTEANGTAAAFVTTPESPDINQPTIEYIAHFVPEATGDHFNPHVTVGIAPADYLDAMLAEPFDEFTFSPVGASVYHLGNYGTAREQLKSLDLNP
jgi:phosphoglycolate phosphatase-like HAD superfamily hydrolase